MLRQKGSDCFLDTKEAVCGLCLFVQCREQQIPSSSLHDYPPPTQKSSPLNELSRNHNLVHHFEVEVLFVKALSRISDHIPVCATSSKMSRFYTFQKSGNQ